MRIPAESVPPMRMTTHVAEAPVVMMEHVQPAPVFASVAPVPAVTLAAVAPVAEDVAPTPAMTHAAEQASVVDCIAPAPAVSYAERAPVVEDIPPTPSLFHAEQAHVDVCIASVPAVTYTAPTAVDDFRRTVEQIVGAPAPQFVEEVVPASALVIEYDAPAPAVSCTASAFSSALAPSQRVMLSYAPPASSSRGSVAERMRLQREAQEGSADRAAAELLAEEPSAPKSVNLRVSELTLI